MLGSILPIGVAVAEVLGHDATAALLAEEEAALGHAVQVRREQFTLGRTCARRAMAGLGLPVVPVLRGPAREPLWPEGLVGSITHCRGYAAAAVGCSARFAALGIDAEPNVALPAGVLGMIATDEERAWLEHAADEDTHWDHLLFSAKESVFKAWYPLTGRWLGFKDAEITLDADSRTFAARLLVTGPRVGGATIHAFQGRYLVECGVILTAVVVAPPPGRHTAAH